MNVEDKVKKVNDIVAEINVFCKTLSGKTAIRPYGKYRGRYGKIDSCHFFDGRIIACVLPYNLTKKDGSFLWDDNEARTYIPYDHFKDTIIDFNPILEEK